jgi:hypothetical protein
MLPLLDRYTRGNTLQHYDHAHCWFQFGTRNGQNLVGTGTGTSRFRAAGRSVPSRATNRGTAHGHAH